MSDKNSLQEGKLLDEFPWIDGVCENRSHWTIRELFEWAEEKGLSDLQLIYFIDSFGGYSRVHHAQEVFDVDNSRYIYLH